jgi:hypothetical protein
VSCQSASALVAPLVQAQSVSADIDAMATTIILGIQDDAVTPLAPNEMVEQVNVVRSACDLAIVAMRSALGVDANSQIEALRAHLEAMTSLAEIAIGLERNPRSLVVARLTSARQIVFGEFGSLDLLEKFIDINPMLPSINFIEPGTEVQLPRT